MISVRGRRAVLRLSKAIYPAESLRAAALAVGSGARIFLREGRGSFEVEILPAGAAPKSELLRLAGEFLNEALSHLYRQKVIRERRETSAAVLSRLFAEGFPAMPPDPLEQLEPQVRADRERDTEELLASARRIERAA